MSGGGYVRQSLNLAFKAPFPVTENDIVHCVLILQGFRPALPLTGGSDNLTQRIMSANPEKDTFLTSA